MLYLQIESPKSSVLNFLDSNSFEVIISIFQRTEKVPDMERLHSVCTKVKLKSDFHIAGQLMEYHPEYSTTKVYM